MSTTEKAVVQLPGQEIAALVESRRAILEKLAPVTGDVAGRAVQTLVTLLRSPKLRQCTTFSLMTCCIDVMRLGLDPNPQLGYLSIIPYHNNETGETEAQVQLQYQGRIEIARRNNITELEAFVIHANDELRGYVKTMEGEQFLSFVPWFLVGNETEPGDPVAVMFIWKMSERRCCRPVDYKYLLKNRSKSKSYRSGKNSPWITDEEEMVIKSGWNLITKMWPRTTDFSAAMRVEDYVRTPEEYVNERPELADVFGVETLMAAQSQAELVEATKPKAILDMSPGRGSFAPAKRQPVTVQEAVQEAAPPPVPPPVPHPATNLGRMTEGRVMELLSETGPLSPDELRKALAERSIQITYFQQNVQKWGIPFEQGKYSNPNNRQLQPPQPQVEVEPEEEPKNLFDSDTRMKEDPLRQVKSELIKAISDRPGYSHDEIKEHFSLRFTESSIKESLLELRRDKQVVIDPDRCWWLSEDLGA